MNTPKPQSFSKHASIDPPYHFVTSVALLFNFVAGIVFLVMSLHTHLLLGIWIVILSIALFLIFWKVRAYPLKVQDRIIRLEERVRLSVLLPGPLQKRIHELSEDQLIGLRFASDDEIPELVQLTLDKQLTRQQIKERIQNWRPDHYRI
jgi:cell division protein FtsL